MPEQRDDDDVRFTGGGRFSREVQAEGGARPLPRARSAAEQAERLASGDAWRDFCRSLERAGEQILATRPEPDDRNRAEGFEYLSGLVRMGLRHAFDLADPAFPEFARNEDTHVKWGAENADNHYLMARVDGDRRYRIRGQRGSCMEFLIEVKEGFMQLGETRNFATLCASEMNVDSDGRFEIIVSRDPAPGAPNWLPLDPDSRHIVIRQYFCDWKHEEPARFWIEVLDAPDLAPAPASGARVAGALDEAGHWIETSTAFWNEWVPQLRELHDPTGLAPARAFVGGADDILYGNDLFRLAEDEALLIEVRPPRARYWQFQLCNLWFVTTDYANRCTSINGAQAHVDRDGLVRFVLAHEDPGVPNWLDTAGAPEGVLQYRWIWSEDNPQPSIQRLPIASLREHLPGDHPRIDAEARRAQIAVRQRHVALRFTL